MPPLPRFFRSDSIPPVGPRHSRSWRRSTSRGFSRSPRATARTWLGSWGSRTPPSPRRSRTTASLATRGPDARSAGGLARPLRANPKRMTFAEIRRQGVSLLAVVAVCTVARASLADHYYVPSESMEPTVHVGDQVIVDKAAYGLRLPLSESYLLELGGPKP